MSFKSTTAVVAFALFGLGAQAQTTALSSNLFSLDHGQVSGEVGYVPPVTSAPSNVSRAEVLQALAAEGPLPTAEGTDKGAQPTKSLRSRAEVRAEAVSAVRKGALLGGKV